MENAENAIEARVAELVDHIDSTPIVQDALPFVVSYLIDRLREKRNALSVELMRLDDR